MTDQVFAVVDDEEISPARPVGRGRERDTFFETTGVIDQLKEVVDQSKNVVIFEDREGKLPTDASDTAKKKRQSAQAKIKRALKFQPWFTENMRPAFRVREYPKGSGNMVLLVKVRTLPEEEIAKRDAATVKRAKARAR